MTEWLGKMRVGHRVRKIGGDYRFEGEIVSIFMKRTGIPRLVVENDDGLLFIFNHGQLELVPVERDL